MKRSSAAAGEPDRFTDPKEALAIVNENDQECGFAPRALVHRLRLLHRAVHVVVSLPDGQFVIQKRSEKKDSYPLHWECVGGHLGPGERYDEAACREVEEELGVTPQKLTYVAKLPPSAETGWEFIEIYRAEVDFPLHPNEHEIAQLRFLTLPQLQEMLARRDEPISPVFECTLRAIGKHIHRIPS